MAAVWCAVAGGGHAAAQTQSAAGDADSPAPGAAEPASTPTAKARAPRTELALLWVPWGMNYTSAALGVELRHKRPLIAKSGVLWDSTNITFGVRELYTYVHTSQGAFV
ncbi:MAG: hypothetical protein AAGC55_30140, partial [Myxococcota bacterium]